MFGCLIFVSIITGDAIAVLIFQ